MEEPNNDIDTDTLQAQIDLAMAQAQNLIASWLPAPSGSLTQSSSRAAEAEAELQALLRRPPRLGVGAPLPETHAPTQARLVQKLQGSKKRARETANGAHADVKKKEEGDEDESSAEESRVGTIRKRTIIDPFDPVGKKGKRRRKEAEEITEGTDGAAQAVHRMAIDEGATDAFDATAELTPKKKKKKKKKSLLPESPGTVGLNRDTHNTIVAQDEGPLTQPPLDTPEQSPPGFPIQRSPTLPFPPILNLTGPPSIAPEDTGSSPRKKRKRKKKKKKPAGDPL